MIDRSLASRAVGMQLTGPACIGLSKPPRPQRLPGGPGPGEYGVCCIACREPCLRVRTGIVADAHAWLRLSDSSSGPDRADARPRRCLAQRPRLGSGCPLGGSGSEALRPSTTAPLLGRRRLPQPHRLRKQHGDGGRRNPWRVDSRTAETMQQSATRDETTPSRPLRAPAGRSGWLSLAEEKRPARCRGRIGLGQTAAQCFAPRGRPVLDGMVLWVDTSAARGGRRIEWRCGLGAVGGDGDL